MTQKDLMDLLSDNLRASESSLGWLKRSYEKCKIIDLNTPYTPDEFDDLEALTSRFARSLDFVIHKVFRSIDMLELEEGGSLIDVVNRAHKRGLFETVEDIRRMKDLRNNIAHEYAIEDLTVLFREVLEWTPKLFRLSQATTEYCRKKWPTKKD